MPDAGGEPVRRTRQFELNSPLLQAVAVFFVAAVLGVAAWYLLWPFGLKLPGALVVGFGLGLFCAMGSVLRGHDIDWERRHVKPLPLRLRRRAYRPGRARRERGA